MFIHLGEDKWSGAKNFFFSRPMRTHHKKCDQKRPDPDAPWSSVLVGLYFPILQIFSLFQTEAHHSSYPLPHVAVYEINRTHFTQCNFKLGVCIFEAVNRALPPDVR